MSNPILRPGDPRFQRPNLTDAGGKSRFADSDPPADSAAGHDPFAATSDRDSRPFVPRYNVQQQPRPKLLLNLSLLGWLGAGLGAIALVGIYDCGWVCPLLGVGPAAAAWLLAHQDLKAIEVGAIDAAALPATRRAHWLGLTALVAALATTMGMIFLQKGVLPDGL